jgi:TRAP transporter TAXI family solute receptor
MGRRLHALGAILVLGWGAALGPAAHAAKISMESGGTNSVVGMVPQAMAANWAKAGVDVQLALDQTLTRSLLKLAQGSLDSSVIPLPAYPALVRGVGPYAKMGDKAKALAPNVRSLFAFTASTYHPIVWADSGIEKWSDIQGKRVFIGPPAGAANAQITGLVKSASGLEEGKDYQGIKAPWGVAADNFRDGQYDVYIGSYAIGSQALVEMSLSRKIRVLSLPNRNDPPAALGMAVATIPAKTYPGLVNSQDIVAWRTLMMLAVNKDMPDDVAYKLTKAYFESIPSLKAGNAALSVLDPDDAFSGLVAPLHPGAVKYYKEAGRAVPDKLIAK